MGVTRAIVDAGLRRVHVLPVEGRGGRLLRIRLEAATVRRGWVIASTPADADVLVVCGDVTLIRREVDAVWAQLPWPSHRAGIEGAEHVDECLDGVVPGLRIARRLPRETSSPTAGDSVTGAHGDHPQHDEQHHGAAPMEHGGDDPDGQPDHGHQEHRGDAEHDMDMHDVGMQMSGPVGIALASGSDDDRDGLEMDELHVSLGPILGHWPGGLAMRLTLHGDLVTAAECEILWDSGDYQLTARDRFASTHHAAADLLALAGWQPMADRLLALRDRALTGEDWGSLGVASARLHQRLRRARMLAWTLPRPGTGGIDVHAELVGMLPDLVDLVDGPGGGAVPAEAASPDRLADVVVGQDLSTARLLVAALTAHGVGAGRHAGHP